MFIYFDTSQIILLQDRHIDDINIANIFILFFKMAESFENLYNILRDWAKDKEEKCLDKAVNGYEKQKKERKRCFVYGKCLGKNT